MFIKGHYEYISVFISVCLEKELYKARYVQRKVCFVDKKYENLGMCFKYFETMERNKQDSFQISVHMLKIIESTG